MNPTDSILTIERTNTRDGGTYLFLLDAAGLPECPHCGTPMTLRGGKYENSHCPCWWKGASECNYYAQVVVSATAEGEEQYRQRQSSAAREIAEKNADAQKLAEARRASLAGKKALTKIHFLPDDFGTVKPKYMPEVVEVTIERCYVKEFGHFVGGSAEVMDVVYPDERKFYIRASQIKSIID